MSMIRCSECGKEISDKAKVCVHCGNPLKNEGQDNNVNEKKIKTKKNNKKNNILFIILILLFHLILFAGGTRTFLNTEIVNANVIYPVKQSAITGLTTKNEYECNIVYEYKGIEYHDKLTFNDDNLPKELKNSSTDPNFFDVKLKGYVYKNSPDNFVLDMEYYNISKYVFYIQVILIIPSLYLIIRNITSLIKNRNKSEKGINKVVLIAVIFLIAIIVGSVIFFISKKKDLSSNKDDTPVDWGLTINGTSIILPCSLDELTKAGVHINEGFYQELMTTTNQTFSGSYAISDEWAQGIYLDLKTGSDVSKKEKNVTVSSIRYYLPAHSFNTTIGITPDESSLLTSSQFSIKNNITIGSKSEDVIEAFGTDYKPKSETDLNGLYALIYYEKGNSTLTIGFENGFVREIKITTTNLSINKKENYDLDNRSQDNSLSNSKEESSNYNNIDSYNTAVAEIKKCLKDVNWLKQNIYITEDEMISNNINISDQQINFIVCENNTKPIIVVETSSDNNLSIKIDLVTYENNKVKVERIGEGHNSHVGYYIDANKCVVRTKYMHMGTCETLLHSIVDGKISLLGSYGYYEEYISNTDDNVELKYTYYIGFDTNFNDAKEVSEDEYERYKKNLNEEQYNFVSIATELTSENIDLYINGY